MFAPTNRDDLRKVYVTAWQKHRAGLASQVAMSPLEVLIAEVCEAHPEYHRYLEASELAVNADFAPETGESNPFLHMGMHIAIREQAGANLPPGFRQAWEAAIKKTGDQHQAEHGIMECLGKTLWEAQRSGRDPNQVDYLKCIKQTVLK